MAKMRFSYHRDAIFEHAAGRARRAENDTKMKPNQAKVEPKSDQKGVGNNVQKRTQNEAFWRPSWDPKGSQDGSSNRVFSDPNGTKIRLIRGILWKTGPDAIGSPLDTHFGAQMEPIGLQLGMGKAATWKQK